MDTLQISQIRQALDQNAKKKSVSYPYEVYQYLFEVPSQHN
jgi:hypothetical protein